MENRHNEACKVVSEQLTIAPNGLIHCDEDKWETLDFRIKDAVYYLCNEWDYIVVD